MDFKRVDFSDALKYQRNKHELSQDRLAAMLSSTHRAFESLNQATLSQWERGKIVPTLLRRIGIAHFFGLQYLYDERELKTVKKALQHPVNFQNLKTIYSHQVTSIKDTLLEKCISEELEMIKDAHYRQNTVHLLDTLSFLGLVEPKVACFYCNDVLVGHVVYQQRKNEYFVVSVVFLNKEIRQEQLEFIEEKSKGMKLYLPIRDQSLSQFISDCFLEKCCFKHNVDFYVGASESFFENPMIINLFKGLYDFRLVRFEQVTKQQT